MYQALFFFSSRAKETKKQKKKTPDLRLGRNRFVKLLRLRHTPSPPTSNWIPDYARPPQLDASNGLHENVHFSFSENEIKTIVNLESSGMHYER